MVNDTIDNDAIIFEIIIWLVIAPAAAAAAAAAATAAAAAVVVVGVVVVAFSSSRVLIETEGIWSFIIGLLLVTVIGS